MLRAATLNLLLTPDALPERVEHLITELVTEDLDFLLLQEVRPPVDGEYSSLPHLAVSLGLPHVTFTMGQAKPFGNAILSKHPLVPVPLPDGVGFPDVPPAVAEAVIDGRRVIVMSHHGAWGSHATAERLTQLRILDGLAQREFTRDGAHLDRATRPVIILGGDFNAVPDSAPIRYLTGLDQVLGHSTIWVDATGDVGHTTGGMNVHATATAASMPGAAYRPERTPHRRIDYLLVYEWAYGQAGEPVHGHRIADTTFTTADGRELTVSDHFGVLAHLWMPEPA